VNLDLERAARDELKAAYYRYQGTVRRVFCAGRVVSWSDCQRIRTGKIESIEWQKPRGEALIVVRVFDGTLTRVRVSKIRSLRPIGTPIEAPPSLFKFAVPKQIAKV
jgi:hypothetical protein